MNTAKKKILWFSPYAGLWPSAELENDLANSWASAGYEITMVRCGGVMDKYCPVMTAEGLTPNASPEKKKAACRECRFNSSILDSPEHSKYATLWIDDFVTPVMKTRAKSTSNLVTHDNWNDFHRDEIPIGRYSSYLTLLHHKLPSPTASGLAWKEYQAELFNSLIALQALPSIFDEVEPDIVAVYNPLYPVNRIFVELAHAREIPMVSVSAGGYVPDRYSTIALYPKVFSSQTSRDSFNITAGMNIPLSALEVSSVTRQVSHQMLGTDPWVYTSLPSEISVLEIRDNLNLRPTAPVVVVLVGSPDETRSSEIVGAEYQRTEGELSDVFEFIEQSLLAARSMPDVDFVIRLHPRLSANKREKFNSPDLIAIHKLMDNCPPNAHLNQTGDGIGLHDTARIASVGLNHASTAGLEFLCLGIPVVHYDPPRINAYPPNFGYQVSRKNQTELLNSITDAIAGGWSIENSRKAYRWLATTLIRSLIHRSRLELKTATGTEGVGEVAVVSKVSSPKLRSLIPRSIRERVSRKMARRQRREQFLRQRSEGLYEDWWGPEAEARLANLDTGDLWEPHVIQRGESLDANSELQLIHRDVMMLVNHMGGLEILNCEDAL